jgi:hypothetical protein
VSTATNSIKVTDVTSLDVGVVPAGSWAISESSSFSTTELDRSKSWRISQGDSQFTQLNTESLVESTKYIQKYETVIMNTSLSMMQDYMLAMNSPTVLSYVLRNHQLHKYYITENFDQLSFTSTLNINATDLGVRYVNIY